VLLKAVVEVLLDALSLRIGGATRRRAIQGRAARETRARKRTLSSRPGPPLAALAPLVAGASLAAGPPREPLPLALT
jgi:hypothetical protein